MYFIPAGRFSEIHKFDKPNDARALNLMNSCAVSMLEKFPDIIFAYGDSDEYRLTTRFSSHPSLFLCSFLSGEHMVAWFC